MPKTLLTFPSTEVIFSYETRLSWTEEKKHTHKNKIPTNGRKTKNEGSCKYGILIINRQEREEKAQSVYSVDVKKQKNVRGLWSFLPSPHFAISKGGRNKSCRNRKLEKNVIESLKTGLSVTEHAIFLARALYFPLFSWWQKHHPPPKKKQKGGLKTQSTLHVEVRNRMGVNNTAQNGLYVPEGYTIEYS